MADQQLWALIVFAAIVMALLLALPTRRAPLDGRQKYRARKPPLLQEDGGQRPSMSPFAAALATLFGGSSSHSSDTGYDDVDSGDLGADFGGDGGGDGGGD
jgi:hypothetical protein